MYPDGRMDIVTVGRIPFRAVEFSPRTRYSRPGRLPGRLPKSPDAPPSSELVDLYETCHTLIFGDCPEKSGCRGAAVLFFPRGRRVPMEFAVETANPRAAHRI